MKEAIFHIRKRVRHDFTHGKIGLRCAWDEWQICRGNRVFGRYDNEHQAKEAMEILIASRGTKEEIKAKFEALINAAKEGNQ